MVKFRVFPKQRRRRVLLLAIPLRQGFGSYDGYVFIFFLSYSLCSGNDKVEVVDDSYSSSAGKGSISMIPPYHSPLFFMCPILHLNLLFVSHLTESSSFHITFFPSHYVFQDLETMTIFGKDHEENGRTCLTVLPK